MDKREYTLDFLRVLLGGDRAPAYSEQEQAALDKTIPMTQELFEGCLDACAKVGNLAEHMELFERFPECGQVWCQQLDKEFAALDTALATQGIEPKPITDEEIRTRWAAFKERMRKTYGDEVADNLADDILAI